MLRGIGLGFLILAGFCTDRGSWESILLFALISVICFLADLAIRASRKRFKRAVEVEVNRKLYWYKKMDAQD